MCYVVQMQLDEPVDACLSVLKGRWIQNPVPGKFLNAAARDYIGSP